MAQASELTLETTPIPGLVVLRLPVHEDSRGWFKENWQREKMTALGLPDFGPVQNNISFNTHRGATRGIHTEPWDKFVSVATGRVFAAWVDMREGEHFGTTFHVEIDPGVAVFVPRGVGNSYQSLEDGTAYSYLVNEHWRAGTTYPALHLADPTARSRGPSRSRQADISEKDQHEPHPGRRDADAAQEDAHPRSRRSARPGAGRQEFPTAHAASRDELDLADPAALAAWPWHEYAVVLNAAAYTAVDAAETRRRAAARRGQINAAGTRSPGRLAREHGLTLVHYSSDYVFDGTECEHDEDEPLSPLGVYGQTKAAGDLAVSLAPQHYILRTSWVIGDGGNFVRTMQRLAEQGIAPSVVEDQVGRLTFTGELARATRHLMDTAAPYGTYNVTNGGEPTSWAALAKEVFRLFGRSTDDITAVTTSTYSAGKALAPRPSDSTLSLAKLRATGFDPEDALVALGRYCATGTSAGLQ